MASSTERRAVPRPDGGGDTGGRPVLAEDLAQGVGPLAGGAAGLGQGDGGRHDVVGALGGVGQCVDEPRRRRRCRAGPATARRRSIISACTAGSTLRMLSSPASGDSAVSVKALTPTTVRSSDSSRRSRSVWERTSRPFSSSMASNAPPSSSTSSSSALARLDQLGGAGLDHDRPVEQVVVLQQVGLEGQHLLDAQRPLLVPRAGQAQGLVPGRELDGAGPGLLRQGHAERLEHDALHVVLGLRFGQAQAVDLHAVAEAARLRVGRRRSARGRCGPTAR